MCWNIRIWYNPWNIPHKYVHIWIILIQISKPHVDLQQDEKMDHRSIKQKRNTQKILRKFKIEQRKKRMHAFWLSRCYGSAVHAYKTTTAILLKLFSHLLFFHSYLSLTHTFIGIIKKKNKTKNWKRTRALSSDIVKLHFMQEYSAASSELA